MLPCVSTPLSQMTTVRHIKFHFNLIIIMIILTEWINGKVAVIGQLSAITPSMVSPQRSSSTGTGLHGNC